MFIYQSFNLLVYLARMSDLFLCGPYTSRGRWRKSTPERAASLTWGTAALKCVWSLISVIISELNSVGRPAANTRKSCQLTPGTAPSEQAGPFLIYKYLFLSRIPRSVWICKVNLADYATGSLFMFTAVCGPCFRVCRRKWRIREILKWRIREIPVIRLNSALLCLLTFWILILRKGQRSRQIFCI